MIRFEYQTKEETFKIYNYIKEYIKKDMFSGYYIENYYEKEPYILYFTLGYDEEQREYELFYCDKKIYIFSRNRYYDHKDIAFITYPISELMLEI